MEEAKQAIDIFTIAERVWKRKRLFLLVSLISTIIAVILILPSPRYYHCSVVLAPESSSGNEGALGSMASMIGIKISNGSNTDAIHPELYPQVLSSNNFIRNLIDINVRNQDGTIQTTYYDYIQKHQKSHPIMAAFGAMIDLFKKKETDKLGKLEKLDLFNMTKEQSDVFKAITGKINCDYNIKTELITISVQDQDPLICATIADSVRTKLQDFIIEYRTNKARIDLEYYQKLTTEAKQAYERARQSYGNYADQNNDIVLQSYRLKENDLENDMQLKFNTYSTLQTQLQIAQAKLQERTPAFIVIKEATVPKMPAGPRRTLFVLTIVFLAFVGTTLYICRDLIVAGLRS